MNKCKTVSSLSITGLFNGTVDNNIFDIDGSIKTPRSWSISISIDRSIDRERERERERERDVLQTWKITRTTHFIKFSFEYPMHYQYVCSDNSEVKSVWRSQRSNQSNKSKNHKNTMAKNKNGMGGKFIMIIESL